MDQGGGVNDPPRPIKGKVDAKQNKTPQRVPQNKNRNLKLNIKQEGVNCQGGDGEGDKEAEGDPLPAPPENKNMKQSAQTAEEIAKEEKTGSRTGLVRGERGRRSSQEAAGDQGLIVRTRTSSP